MYVPRMTVVAPVAPERLTKSYHRVWHERNARYHALMPAEDLYGHDGRTGGLIMYRGVPLFTYRQLAQELCAIPFAWLQQGPGEAFHHELRVRHLWRYITSRRRIEQPCWSASLRELVFAIVGLFRKKRWVHP